jgi:hypothetical protein
MEYGGVRNETFDHGAVASGTRARDLDCQDRSQHEIEAHEGTRLVGHTPQGHLMVNQSDPGTSMDARLGR